MGLLEGEEKRELMLHLTRGCEVCNRNLRQALALNALLLSSAPAKSPPRRLRWRVLGTFGLRRPGWGWLGALAAACLLAIVIWLRNQERHGETELAAVRRDVIEIGAQRDRLAEAINFLNQPESRRVIFGESQPQRPRGNVFVNPRLGILLIASNLPPLPPGRTYEMWLIYAGAGPRPAGLFAPNAQGSGFNVLSGPINTTSLETLTVTAEPAAGSQAPTTKPILAANL